MRNLLCALLDVYQFVLFGRIMLSWFPITQGTAMARVASVIYDLTEPVLGPARRMIPPARFGGAALDFSPLLVIFGLVILRGAICS